MSLSVTSFAGGIVVDGSADSQRVDECQVLDSFDISPRGQLIVTTDVTDYLLLRDDGPVALIRLWALLECAGFNFSKVVAVGEGSGANAVYLMTSFNREGETSPIAMTGGFGYEPPPSVFPVLPPMVQGSVVTGADFAGIFPINFTTPGGAAGTTVQVRLYLINIGAREGVAPNVAPGLYMVSVVPPNVIPSASPIQRFDALGTGSSGLLTVPISMGGEGAANGGTHGRQLYFRGIIAYNNFVFGWGFDNTDHIVGVISGITNAVNGVVTVINHGFSVGDRVTIRGVNGMPLVNSQNPYTIGAHTFTANTFDIGIDTTAFGAYVSAGVAVKGNGDGPARVMFSNLGNPLKWGNDNIAATDRVFTDSDAIVLGDAGELIRGAIVWGGKLYFGTNKGLHYVSGYGRDSFVTDGATPVMRSYNVVGPHAMIEGPDKHLYGVSDQGLWRLDVSSPYVIPVPPKPLFQQLRDYKGRSNGYWDLIWTDYTRSAAAYPGQTNQDLIWMAVDWERQQVVIGIPWCSIANGYGFGSDTVVIKYNCNGGGFTRQQFTGVQYTAAGYFRAVSQQAACRFVGTATAGQATVKRYGYKLPFPLFSGPFDAASASPVLPASLPKVRFGPYLPFGPDGDGVVKRLYAVLAWDALNTPLQITGITNANPGVVTTSIQHGFSTGQQIDIYGNTSMTQIIGTYTIVFVTGISFSLKTLAGVAVDTTTFTAFGSGTAFVGLPLAFSCKLTLDEQIVQGQIDQAVAGNVVGAFALSVRPVAPSAQVFGVLDAFTPQEGDLWVDTSETDQNLGNATAGSFTLALNGYLGRSRKDNKSVAITGITKANPCVVTAPAHGFFSGQRVSFRNVGGMTQLNNDAGAGPYTRDATTLVIDADHFSLVGIDSSGFSSYTSGGTVGLAWLLVPGLGGTGNRATIPIPTVRRPGTRYTLDLLATTLARRMQVEGLGIEPGGGESDA